MDKQMIEDMATEIAKTILSCPLNQGKNCDVCKFNDKDTISYDCQSYLVAEKLLEKYQPKIPEGVVVLTGTETEQRLEDLLIEFDEMSFYPATLMPNPDECVREWKEKLIYAIGQLCKERVEKIFKELKEKHTEVYNKYVFAKSSEYDDLEINAIINFSDSLYFAFDEICKEITEGL